MKIGWLGGATLLGALLLLMTPKRAFASMQRYAGDDLTALFREASSVAGTPPEWAHDPALHAIVQNESGGWAGRPNYQFGDLSRTDRVDLWPHVHRAILDGTWRLMLAEPWKSGPHGAQSSATGLGQLTSTNIASGLFYPSGLRGIGDAREEAIGMLRYVLERYGSPAAALAHGMKSGKWAGY